MDLGYLDQLDVIPGWPGAEVYPPQPMVSQMHAVLDAYEADATAKRSSPIAATART